MNWDESSYEYAEARSSEYFGHLPEQMFEHGAKWQRDQLRTNEAVERVAAHMCADTTPEQIWPLLNTYAQDEWRAEARAAITALLGDN